MAVVAIITARGGSKRIPRKNVRPFRGKPIIAYSIAAALDSGLFDEVMVSTDDQEIAELSKKLGARVPFMRSAKNADDFATTNDVLLEVLGEYRRRGAEYEVACCIYPTAPFVTAEKLRSAFARLQESGADTVLPIVRFGYPIRRSFKREGEKVSYRWPEFSSHRSQDLPSSYHDAGQFYFFRPSVLFDTDKMITGNTVGIEMPALEVEDLDEEENWSIAELKFTHASRRAALSPVAGNGLSRLMLGAAQFGMDYGISNVVGRVGRHEVREIMRLARMSGIRDVDTAQSYGESENVLGEIGVDDWNVYTKLPVVPKDILGDRREIHKWVSACVHASLVRLRSDNLAGLMLHHPEQLVSEGGGAIYDALAHQRQRGLVQAIGISIYGPRDLSALPPSMIFDFVQGPLNVLDMRLARSGWLARLAESGCAFFARSIFLQGLLLMPASERQNKFDLWSEVWRAWEQYLRETGMTAVEACLRHALSVPNVCKVVAGLTSAAEMNELALASKGDFSPLPDGLSLEDERLLEPMNWTHL
jgi:pseudaminic acid cytidylyltransferase